ncbi:stage III sporulation protein AB [Heliorestis convoluta]|uniref:Putative stage III sporulation AB protein n=1 Tax=Heliorestis convoluta TaxID=356322 RepID=A0A5Q2MXH6_9FIRM|nr:stage III sporulation protein AB [Heliorestis convoluta]QGG46561.1 putative stage III sporulation AB protein [Heliorestis convoluta]
MWKIIGALLILGACSSAGLWKAAELHRRPKILAQLQSSLSALSTEISYGAVPLPQAMEQAGRISGEPTSQLFLDMAQRLRGSQGRGADELWSESLQAWIVNTALQKKEGEEIERLALGLGSAPKEDQLLRIEEVKKRLEWLEKEAREDCQRLAKVWSYGGVLAGAAIVLVLW